MVVRGFSLAERGVSEAIGFILIFSIVIAGIGLVTLYGYPMLLKQQTSANERIMEKNMIVLQNDVKSLAYKTVPYKETSLKIDGGSLTVYNSTSTPAVSRLDIRDCDPSGDEYIGAFQSGDLRYSSESAGTDISLQNGAVVMRPHAEPGSVMLAEPRWFYDAQTNTMVINLIGFNSSYTIARAGIGTVQMAMGETGYTRVDIPAGNLLCVVYTPDPTPEGQNYQVAWDNYFINSMKMTPTGTDHEYRLPTDVTNPAILVIKKYDVIIKSL
ncbi:MAG: hypothetical protein LUQ66_06140 [Methanoregula sp.]|nr:hypothetical protein [Methanoregula sp.]